MEEYYETDDGINPGAKQYAREGDGGTTWLAILALIAIVGFVVTMVSALNNLPR